MTQVLTAYSLDPDNTENAVEDILRQLDLEHKLLKNSVGLLFTYLDFIGSGMVKALCGRLPFNVLGCTSQGFVAPGAAEEIMLTLMVLTSDEVVFSAALSEPLAEEGGAGLAISGLYRQSAAALEEKPSLIFIVASFQHSVLGDKLIEALDRESGGVPIFGTTALDIVTEVRTPLVIYNGEAYSDRVPLLLMSGIRDFKFFLVSLPGNDIFHQQAVVTASEGVRIIDLDHEPAVNYLQKVGLVKPGTVDVLYAFPIEVDYHDGMPPRIFAIYDINPDGSINSGGLVPVGCSLSIGSMGSNIVLETAAYLASQIKNGFAGNGGKGNGLLIISCFSRNTVLPDPSAEMRLIQTELRDFGLPYLFLYSGGEYCPRYDEKGETSNRYHQYTIIACLF